MADTYSQIYIHLIFAVQHRQQLISDDWREDLHRLVTKIVKNHDQHLVRINSVEDHLHLLVAIKPVISISDLVRELKTGTANYINKEGWTVGKFEWQNGFSAFSVSKSDVDRVVKYIDQQQEHHRRRSFQEEYHEFLEKHEVEYDDRYVFDFRDSQ